MALANPPKAVTFDCYGTLVDWEGGLERELLFILRGKPDPPGLDRAVAAWGGHERALTSGKEGYRAYREVVSEALRLAYLDLDIPWDARDGARLAASVGTWEPFPDAPPALETLADMGYRTGILSNVDDDLLAQTQRRLGAPMGFTVTAQQVKAYKPDEAHFLEALRRLALPAEQVLHVSFSPYHDLEPAHRLGFRTFFVDRKGFGESEVPVDHQGRDLGALVQLLGP